MLIPFRLRQLDHVVLRVRDVAAMRRFYCDVLGCTPELDQPGIGLFQLRAGDSLIDLVDVDGKLGLQGGGARCGRPQRRPHLPQRRRLR